MILKCSIEKYHISIHYGIQQFQMIMNLNSTSVNMVHTASLNCILYTQHFKISIMSNMKSVGFIPNILLNIILQKSPGY